MVTHNTAIILRLGGETIGRSGLNSEINGCIDEVACRMLCELQRNARVSFAKLARRVGLPPSATAEWVRRLEDSEIIRGYQVEVDPRTLGYNMMVFTRLVCDGEKYRQFLTHINSLYATQLSAVVGGIVRQIASARGTFRGEWCGGGNLGETNAFGALVM